MRNQRSGNYIPIPTKPVKGIPRALPRILVQKRSSSCQTERLVLIKEENLTFYPCSRLCHNDSGMRRDYIKAVNYINSCHKFINAVIEKNAIDKSNTFVLPMVTNFVPIFPYLIGKKFTSSKKEKKEQTDKRSTYSSPEKQQTQPKSDERKCKSNFAVKQVPCEKEAASPHPVSVGDCDIAMQQSQSPASLSRELTSHQLADIVKQQMQHFWSSIKHDLDKKVKSKGEGKMYEKNRTKPQEVSNVRRNLKSRHQMVQYSPRSQIQRDFSEDCSTIFSDTDYEDMKRAEKTSSVSSLLTQSSDDIRSDSEIEINHY